MNVRLKIRILEAFKSQWLFASRVGAHESDVSRVIHGRRKLSPGSKRLWADALGCKSPSEIFDED